MKSLLCVNMITKNAETTIEKTLQSIEGWVEDIVIVDSYSTDRTLEIARKYRTRIFRHKYEGEGKQRNFALTKAKSDWVLVLDADEEITPKLKTEVLSSIKSTHLSGFNIPIQSYYLGRKLFYGGESYKKMILFKRDKGYCTTDEIHAVYKTKDKKTGSLKNKLNHYSYLSFLKTIKKFTNYSARISRQRAENGEKSSFKKIFLYPLHMFYARFIEDEGYKDGLFRIPLDLGFAYMEFLTYFYLLFTHKKKNIR